MTPCKTIEKTIEKINDLKFHLTASLAQAISDDLHFMVRIFPSPSCRTVALFLNQPLSVKINCKGHTSVESQYTLLQYN